MKKIGFIDNFLSEWHANNYPDMIRKNPRAQELGFDVCYAYAKTEVSPYDGVTTDEWCKEHKVERCNSVEELVDKSDYIVVLSPDNPELHYELSEYALKSGKPTYIDKTFSPDRATAEKLFGLAKKYNTPMYSTSALRFADELKPYRENPIGAAQCVVCGCYVFDIYAIHIFEMMCTVMKSGAVRLMAVQNGRNRNIVVDYGKERYASFLQMHTDGPVGVPFLVSVEMPDGSARFYNIQEGYQERSMEHLVNFFATGIPEVDSGETIDLMGMLDAARKALKKPFTWFKI